MKKSEGFSEDAKGAGMGGEPICIGNQNGRKKGESRINSQMGSSTGEFSLQKLNNFEALHSSRARKEKKGMGNAFQ